MAPVAEMAGREVATTEGLVDGDEPPPAREAWLEWDVARCGSCRPGRIMAAVALLKRTGDLTDAGRDEIANVCRRGTYFRVREAIGARR